MCLIPRSIALSLFGLFFQFALAAPASAAALYPETISAGWWHTCGIKTDGTLACWGWNKYGQATPPSGTFVQVSAGGVRSCALKTDRTLACWGG